MITSIGNPQIKNMIRLLKSPKARKEQRLYAAEGIKMFLEAEKLGIVEKAFLSEELYEQWAGQGESLLSRIDYEVTAYKVFKEMAETVNPQGMIALVRFHEANLEELLNTTNGCFLFLDNLRDPGNLGTIIRTAEGAGISGIICSKESVDIYNPKVVRSTMGSIFRMPHVYVEDWKSTLLLAKKHGVRLYASDLGGSRYYDEADFTGKYGIIVGNEANGISKESRESADCLLKIPMCGEVESLNAAVAASVMAYEAFRQRRK